MTTHANTTPLVVRSIRQMAKLLVQQDGYQKQPTDYQISFCAVKMGLVRQFQLDLTSHNRRELLSISNRLTIELERSYAASRKQRRKQWA